VDGGGFSNRLILNVQQLMQHLAGKRLIAYWPDVALIVEHVE
jgi:hypothetical protein